MQINNPNKILSKSYQEQLAHPKGTKGIKAIIDMQNANAEVIDTLISFLPKLDNMTIADVGCGHTYTISRINEIARNSTLFGIDNSELVLRKARDSLKNISQKTNKIELIYGGTPNLPFKKLSLDVVLLINLVYFWEDLEENFENIDEKLKDEALIAIYVTDNEDLKKRIDTAANIYHFHELDEISAVLKKYDFELTRSKKILRSNGQFGHILIFQRFSNNLK